MARTDSLYGLKIAFENLGDAFIFNRSEQLQQEINHSDTRLGELESALAANRTDAADRALNQYWQDMNQTEQTLSWFNNTSSMPEFNGTFNGTGTMPEFNGNYNGTGYSDRLNWTGYTPAPIDPDLVHAQQMILLHQEVLENLLNSHPDNQGLTQAYNKNRDLEQRFEQKTQLQFDLLRDAENRPIFRPVLLSAIAQNRTLPVYSWNKPGPAANRVAPMARNQTWDTSTHPGNGQYHGQVNQSGQDQQRQDLQVNPGHDQNPANRQRNSNGNESDNAYINRSTYGNRDFRFYNP